VIQVLAVPPDEVREAAKFLEPFIQRACVFENADELIQQAEDHLAVLWIVAEDNRPVGISFCHRIELVDGRIAIWVTALAGFGFKRWIQAFRDKMHQFRNDENAELLVVKGRKGWARVFGIPPRGQLMDGHWLFEDYG
jgi:hypothetical protein